MTVSYADAVTSITGQLSTALTAGLPVWGTILGVVVGIGFFKDFFPFIFPESARSWHLGEFLEVE